MKKYLGIFAIMLAITASAFTVKHKDAKLAGSSYTYNLYGQPGQNNSSNLINPANYTFVGTSSLSCSGTINRCGVEDATDDGFGHPDFTKSYTIRVRN